LGVAVLRLPNPSHGGPLSAGRWQARLCPHPQRLRPRGRTRAGGCAGELSERRRLGHRARGAAALYGRDRTDRRGMTGRPLRILLTNDDGVDAPGLAVLRAIAESLSDDVW